MAKVNKPLIGFIGQGWIGKNYADDFERRGYKTVRYALEEPYRANKAKVAEADIVFIAVPTPTTPEGFQDGIVRDAVSNVGKGRIAVIKSTLVPGTLRSIQKQYPDIMLMHCPEFLSRGTAKEDAAHPIVNIIGIPSQSKKYKDAAKLVLSVLPKAHSMITSSETAELYKYVHNTTLFARSIYMNLLFETAEKLGVNWDDIKDLIQHDPMVAFQTPVVSHWHIEPRHTGGRGIGGDCHIKDMETFSRLYKKLVGDTLGSKLIDAMKSKNIELLLGSKKDLNLLSGVYGTKILKGAKKRRAR
jgi:UDP-glucose 6-dehydrogenase